MTAEAGMLACTAAGGLVVDVEGERCRIEAGDVKSLIFSGRPESKTFGFLPLRSSHLAVLMLAFARTYRTIAPVMGERGDIAAGLTIEGYAAVNPPGERW